MDPPLELKEPDGSGSDSPSDEDEDDIRESMEPETTLPHTESFDGSITKSLSSTLDDLRAQQADARFLRQHILTSPTNRNRTALLNELSDLEDKIEAAVDTILEEKANDKCMSCVQLEIKLSSAISEKEKAEYALKDSGHRRDLAERDVDLLQGECTQSEIKIQTLEGRIEGLNSNLGGCLKQSDAFAADVLRLDSALREARSECQMKSQDLERAGGQHRALIEQQSRLDTTIDLLVEDYRNATEKLVDAEDARELMILTFISVAYMISTRLTHLMYHIRSSHQTFSCQSGSLWK